MNLIRTFHPVGQGAFYTERHIFNEIEFTVVYDCGSTTLNKSKLERKIKSTFPKNHIIDILFISHFHADHINGIEILHKHCKIKRVVLPLIDNDAKALIKISNLIDGNYSDVRIIDNPSDFFGKDVPIITIISTDENSNDNINIENTTNISTIDSSTNIASGTVFIPFTNIDWFFVPFNYRQNDRKKQFEDQLRVYGLTLANLNNINKINERKDDIIKAYNAVDGDLNKNSMVLFSGKCSDDPIYCFEHLHSFYYHRFFDISFQSGCLYMGDINLNEPSISSDIKTKLRLFLDYIGTLQVPHHGSIHNFDNSILPKKLHCAIFSYGTTNTYGHPSDRVIGNIMAKNIHPHFVTEEQHSIVTQWK